MLATVMNSLDTTIANVALPHMAGSVSASQDQITWVLTSYIIAAAIMTPLSGWLADRHRPQAGVPGLDRRLHRRLDAVRRRQQPGRDRALPPAAGPVRRGADPALAGGGARHLSARAGRPGDGDLGRRRDPGADLRTGAGRLADRQLLLALGVLHQPADRRPGLQRRVDLHVRRPRQGRRGRSTSSASARWWCSSARCS